MKVLVVDSFSSPHTVDNTQGLLKAYSKVAIAKPFDYRRGGPVHMNARLIETAMAFQPDLLHLGKAEKVTGATVKEIKRRLPNTYVIYFYCDYRPKLQQFVIDIGRYADCTLFNAADERVLGKYHEAGVKHVGGWWSVGTDPEIFYPRKVKRAWDLLFMAHNQRLPHKGYPKRRQLVAAILDAGFDLHLFGTGWGYLKERKNAHLHPFAGGEKFADACSRAKITLGINGVNDVRMCASWRRAFNSMASGAFHLTHYIPGLETFFEDKKHLVWFHSVPEAIELIKYYLPHEIEREKIATAGRQIVLADHIWDKRIEVMMDRWRQWHEEGNRE